MYLKLNYELIISGVQVNHGWIMSELLSHGWKSIG
jgi:hypothetical protein